MQKPNFVEEKPNQWFLRLDESHWIVYSTVGGPYKEQTIFVHKGLVNLVKIAKGDLREGCKTAIAANGWTGALSFYNQLEAELKFPVPKDSY